MQAPPKRSTARAVAQRAAAQARKTKKMTREMRKSWKNLMRRRKEKTGKMSSSSLPHSRRRVR